MMTLDTREKETMKKKDLDFNLHQMLDGTLKQDMQSQLILVKSILIEEDKMNLDLKSLSKLTTLNMLHLVKSKWIWTTWESIQMLNQLQPKKLHQKQTTTKKCKSRAN